MNYATIGTSWITEKFISSANTVKDMKLSAVYSRDLKKAEEFSKKHFCEKYYTDLEALANDKEIDAVYIASPNKFHYEQSKFFLKKGKHVICEKPATTTKEQMIELFNLSEENGLVYAEAIMTIHTEGFRAIQNKLESLGNIRSSHFDFYQLSSKYPLYCEGKNPNIFNPEMHTGCLMDIGVYNLYLAAALFGMPQKIISDGIFLENGCDAAGTAILKYKNHACVLNYSKAGQTYSYSEIIGDKGTLKFSSVSQITGLYFCNKNEKILLIDEEVSRDEIMSGEIDFFKGMCNTPDFNNEEYLFAKQTALTVREICDTIRADNDFLF